MTVQVRVKGTPISLEFDGTTNTCISVGTVAYITTASDTGMMMLTY